MSESEMISGCPDVATLRALLDGTLPDEQQATTQAHVDQCPICEAALRQMTAGGESWVGMAEKLKGESSDDPKLAAAMERLKTDDGSASETGESVDPQRTIDFLQPSDDPKSLGRLGQHEVQEVVGWGGMGVVLKAYDPGLHRVVAVKVLASHLAHHAVARKRFIREAQAAAAVCHDNVVTIHAIEDGVAGFGEPGSVSPRIVDGNAVRGLTHSGSPNVVLPKIVMQFVAGGSLQERIDQEGPLELKEILRIAMQTAAGLAAAHAQGVVHRDVKPANILLENGVQRVKLTDFGLARVMDDASLTLSGVIAGTPQYMAPEQAWGREVDARADLFSLGAVMYAMCAGHSPFRARTTMAVLKRVCEDAPRPLRAINPDVPDWLVTIIEKLLAKNPNERFQSATEVSELLGRWLAHAQQPTVVPAPPRVHSSSHRTPFQSQVAAEPLTVSGKVGPDAIPSLSNKESVFMALAMVGGCVPLAGLVMFHFATLPPPAPPLDPGLRYLILSMFWGQFLTLVVTTAINFRRRSLEVIPTILQCVALCLTIYFIPVAIMGFRLLGKRMKSDSPVDENSARRESPELAASPDRRSPEFSRGVDDEVDLRSRPSAGSGDPRTTGSVIRGQLPARFVVWPLIVMWVLLGVMFALVMADSGMRNIEGFLGFSAIQLVATFVLASVFRSAWNSSSWLVWIGSLLFLPLAASLFALGASYRDAAAVTQWMNALQALSAMAYWLGLLFVRPLFVQESDPRQPTRSFSWERVLALSGVLLVPVSLWVVWRMRMGEASIRQAQEAAGAAVNMNANREAAPKRPDPRRPQLDERGFPKPELLSSNSSPEAKLDIILAEPNTGMMPPSSTGGSAAMAVAPDSLKPLVGRWVVVSSEGAALGSAPSDMDGAMMGSALGAAVPGTFDAFGATGGGMASGGFAGSGPMRAGPASAPLQWIKFAADHVVVFDGRDRKLFVAFDASQEPKQLSLRTQPEGSSGVWRSGIFRLERDRLILCWTSSNHPLPTEFATENHPAAQLLVLRREWNPPPDFDPIETPPPKAAIPFTADEAKRFQEAWARSARVPIETTNSLGMKLRLLPAGAFDSAGVEMIDGFKPGAIGTALSRPLYFGVHEVTVGQFRKFVEATGYESSAERSVPEPGTERFTWRVPGIVQDSDQHPVVHVSWEDAQAFCRWLSDSEKQSYRIPTVAEWVYSARAGMASIVRIKPPANARLKFFDTTTPIGADTMNPFGLHELFGNVGEWINNPSSEKQDTERCFAFGGSFSSPTSKTHFVDWLILRGGVPSSAHFNDIGIRVVRESQPAAAVPQPEPHLQETH